MFSSRPGFHEPDWNEIIAAMQGRRLLVVGDVMLDEYISGDARRVCPEAPVPVIEASRRWCVPGGAGNAAANVAALGGRPVLGGVTGDDYAASELAKATKAAGIDPSGFVTDPSRPTTAKLRVLARGHPFAWTYTGRPVQKKRRASFVAPHRQIKLGRCQRLDKTNTPCMAV
jgi:sugar/nucleoside kinase (ribokinase family)